MSLWTLRDVPDLAFDSLGVPRDSVLGKAVAKHFEGQMEEEEAKRAAMDALAIGATLVGFMAGGPLGAMVAGAAVGGAVTVAQLAEDYSKFQAQSSAGGVALDPELAKMSTEEPDLFAVVTDVIALGFPIADAVAAAKALRGAIAAFKASRDAEALATEVRKVIRDPEKAQALCSKLGISFRPTMRDARTEFIEGLRMDVFESRREAQTAYVAALHANPDLEVGVWRDRQRGRFVVAYGDMEKIIGPDVTRRTLWELVVHHHPGLPIAARLTQRIPSMDDFKTLLAPQRLMRNDRVGLMRNDRVGQAAAASSVT